MGINVRAKGANGEREVVRMLNGIIENLLSQQQWPADVVSNALKCIQRNQNQSAVGGSDLSGVFGLAIEIKRHENIQIEPWWKQCTEQAARNGEHPVLLYRKNHQPWRCVTMGHAPLPGGRMSAMRVQFEEDSFTTWFYQWVYYKMIAGETIRV
jgi:hypothetical protein